VGDEDGVILAFLDDAWSMFAYRLGEYGMDVMQSWHMDLEMAWSSWDIHILPDTGARFLQYESRLEGFYHGLLLCISSVRGKNRLGGLFLFLLGPLPLLLQSFTLYAVHIFHICEQKEPKIQHQGSLYREEVFMWMFCSTRATSFPWSYIRKPFFSLCISRDRGTTSYGSRTFKSERTRD
jgi:hypothetical protein